MKKFIVLLTVSALVLALAPTTQASDLLIDSYSIAVTSTSNTGDWASPLHILNPLGYATTTIEGSPAHATGPFEYGTVAGAAPGLDGDLHVINNNSTGQTDTGFNNPDGTKMWLKFDLAQNYNLTQLRVWNGDFFRMTGENYNYGVNQVDLYYSSAEADPGDDFNTGWTLIGTAGAQHFSIPTIASGSDTDGTFGVTDEIDLNSIDARWFAIKANSTHGGTFMKIAEVQFLGRPAGEYYPYPTPADEDLDVDLVTLSELSWLLPEDLSAGSSIECWIDVYDPCSVVDENYVFPDPALTGIVSDLTEHTASVDFVPEPLREYIWKIEIVDSVYPADPNLNASVEFTFETGTGNDDPLIDAGDASYTWLVDGEMAYVLDGAVLNEAFDDVSSITWTRIDAVDPNAVVRAGTEGLLAPTVDIIGGGKTYEFQLEVINFGVTYTDTVTLTVYNDICTAMKNAAGYDVNAARARGDFNYNCEGDLDDLMQLALNWLESSALTY